MLQHWVEFEESGEVVKSYMQRSDYTESKNAENTRAFESFSAAAPLAPLSVDGGSAVDIPGQKPSAQQEVQV